MGPRSRERGNRISNLNLQIGEIASMGPRSRERGNMSAPLEDLVESLFASMGPRSRERGNPEVPDIQVPGIIGFNGAAFSRTRKRFECPPRRE